MTDTQDAGVGYSRSWGHVDYQTLRTDCHRPLGDNGWCTLPVGHKGAHGARLEMQQDAGSAEGQAAKETK